MPAHYTLDRVHLVLQAVMGWQGEHTHRFETYFGDFSDLSLERDYGLPPSGDGDETARALGDCFLSVGDEVIYLYDPMDRWDHYLRLDDVLPQRRRRPALLAGAMACPPEGVGGASGFEQFLRVIRDPTHRDHQGWSRWYQAAYGRDFTAEQFDVRKIARELRAAVR